VEVQPLISSAGASLMLSDFKHKLGRPGSYFDTEVLHELVHQNIDSARVQIERSKELVSHSRELVARIRNSMTQARRIHADMSSPANPAIAREK